jgi:hypothetical protein
MNHLRSASRYPLKGATPVAWQSQFHGVRLGLRVLGND